MTDRFRYRADYKLHPNKTTCQLLSKKIAFSYNIRRRLDMQISAKSLEHILRLVIRKPISGVCKQRIPKLDCACAVY